MFVIEIYLPLKRNDGSDQPAALFASLRAELTERFGGLTAFTRAPAVGLCEDGHAEVERDEIVIFEVIAHRLDRGWWNGFRERLERDFEQDELLIRSHEVERL